jgi:hypothetical protein
MRAESECIRLNSTESRPHKERTWYKKDSAFGEREGRSGNCRFYCREYVLVEKLINAINVYEGP